MVQVAARQSQAVPLGVAGGPGPGGAPAAVANGHHHDDPPVGPGKTADS